MTPTDVIALARTQIGYVESPMGSNRTKYGAWYGMDGQPWCAMFLSWVFFHAGLALPASTSKGFAYTPSGAHWFQRQGRWGSRPLVGALVFYDFPGDGVNRISHVGLVEAVNADGSITAIEGNTDERGGRTGGKVMRRYRRVGIVGYGYPAYRFDPEPPATPPPPSSEFKEKVMALPMLQEGSTGHYVKNMQALLCNHAADLVGDADKFIDGVFGPNTEQVLRTWQGRTKTLTADGVCGPKTWAWLVGV